MLYVEIVEAFYFERLFFAVAYCIDGPSFCLIQPNVLSREIVCSVVLISRPIVGERNRFCVVLVGSVVLFSSKKCIAERVLHQLAVRIQFDRLLQWRDRLLVTLEREESAA